MRVAIFFGGRSREREISFSGGKTAFDHLDNALFERILVFVDSFGRFIKLRAEWMTAKTIRDFYPTLGMQLPGLSLYAESYPKLVHHDIPKEIGEEITPKDFAKHFDFALLAMHGPWGEDGTIQGLLEWFEIPYSGSGLMGSAIGIDKILQNDGMALVTGQRKKYYTISYDDWANSDALAQFRLAKERLGLPLVVKAPHQGSSIGVSIVWNDDLREFGRAVDQCYFQKRISAKEWIGLPANEKELITRDFAELDKGIGFPCTLQAAVIYTPKELESELDKHFSMGAGDALLISVNAEDEVLLEEFIDGQEFTCGCIQNDNRVSIPLPPTEIVMAEKVFDFEAKYKPGASKKRTPVDTTAENNIRIQQAVKKVVDALDIKVCVRIDGFLRQNGEILLHDPNTVPGMSPTSIILKQMAEIGLNITDSLTYFVRQSLRERIYSGKNTFSLRKQLSELDAKIAQRNTAARPVSAVRVSDEESFRRAKNWYSTTAAAGKTTPQVVVDLAGQKYLLTPALLLKDSLEEVMSHLKEPANEVIEATRQMTSELTLFYAGDISSRPRLLKAGDKLFDDIAPQLA